MTVRNRLTEMLAVHKERVGSFESLAEEISAAAQQELRGRRRFDRRKLKRIISGKGYSLTPADLEMLDAFLSRHGQGLAEVPILEREGVLHALAHQGTVALFVGVRPLSPRTHYADVWTVRSLSRVLTSLHRIRPAVDVQLQDVPFTGFPDQERRQQLGQFLSGVPAACCLGSPRACNLSELMLAEMLGVQGEVFRPPGPRSHRLPFYFVWPDRAGSEFRSRFALASSHIRDDHPELADEVDQGEAYALELDGKIYPVRWRQSASHDYGVIVAQRRGDGSVWAVVAGASGPGTYAAVCTLASPDFHITLRPAVGDRAGAAVFAVVEADMAAPDSAGTAGDYREMTTTRILLPPRTLAEGS